MNNKGITLIALVITIIVLLILAGVSIAMLTGQNGILTQASNAKSDTAKAEIAEKVNMAVQAAYATKVTAGSGVASSALTVAEVKAQYSSDNGSTSVPTSGGVTEVDASTNKGKLTVVSNRTNYEVTLTKSGNSFAAVTKDDVQ